MNVDRPGQKTEFRSSKSRHFSHLSGVKLWAFTQYGWWKAQVATQVLNRLHCNSRNPLKTCIVELFNTRLFGLEWKMQCILCDFSADC